MSKPLQDPAFISFYSINRFVYSRDGVCLLSGKKLMSKSFRLILFFARLEIK
jgi:hypothetical protein